MEYGMDMKLQQDFSLLNRRECPIQKMMLMMRCDVRKTIRNFYLPIFFFLCHLENLSFLKSQMFFFSFVMCLQRKWFFFSSALKVSAEDCKKKKKTAVFIRICE
jgi:hypothetical protein